MLNTLVPMLGIGMVLLVAWGLSENRRAVPWRTVIGGMALQLALALVLIGFPPATRAVLALNDAVHALQTATDAGTRFVFGYLGGPPYPFSEPFPGAAFISRPHEKPPRRFPPCICPAKDKGRILCTTS